MTTNENLLFSHTTQQTAPLSAEYCREISVNNKLKWELAPSISIEFLLLSPPDLSLNLALEGDFTAFVPHNLEMEDNLAFEICLHEKEYDICRRQVPCSD